MNAEDFHPTDDTIIDNPISKIVSAKINHQ